MTHLPIPRAEGALYGLAIGDALGMPTQLLSRPEIVARYGPLLTGFEPAPDRHPIAAGHPAGAITDDTEQAVLLGRVPGGGPGPGPPRGPGRRRGGGGAGRGRPRFAGPPRPPDPPGRGRRPGRHPARASRPGRR